VIKQLIECPELSDDENKITVDDVRSAFDDPTKFEGYFEFILRIVRLLRPHSPKKVAAANGGLIIPRHFLIIGPFVYLANILLRAAGYAKFCRRIFPVSSAGSLWPFPLNATGIFECLCSTEGGHYDIPPMGDVDITSINIAEKRRHRDAILAAFFDVKKIHKTCEERGLVFTGR